MSDKKNKTVILVSGGLDSYIAFKLTPDPKIGIFVNFGQPYADKEKTVLQKLFFEDEYKEIEISNLLPQKPEIDNWIIPGRNLLLVTIGAMYGNTVILSALDGEMHKFARERDKTPEFYHLASGLLTYIFDIQQPETKVITRFQNKTKTEVVAMALRNDFSEENLKLTSSCYHPSEYNCGLCGTCFKRWIAMTNNDIEEDYLNDPWKNEYAKNSIQQMEKAWRDENFTHYSKKRCLETFKALKKHNINYL